MFNNITEVIKCKRCSSRIDLEVLACSDDGKLLDAVMNCVGCGAAYVVSEGVLLGLKSRVNEGRISAFNDKYGRSYTIGHSKSGYVEYVEGTSKNSVFVISPTISTYKNQWLMRVDPRQN